MNIILHYLVGKLLLCLSDYGLVPESILPDMFLELDSRVWH
jgi:hypothetical protein